MSNTLVTLVMVILAIQCLAGMLWTLCTICGAAVECFLKFLYFVGASIGFTGTFVDYAFKHYKTKWWGR